jgi:hypothetical protein
MARIPVQITVSVGSKTPGSVTPISALETAEQDPTNPQVSQGGTIEAQLDIDWQPDLPRISFAAGSPNLGSLGLHWLSDHLEREPAAQMDDELAHQIARAIEAGRDVVLTIRRV